MNAFEYEDNAAGHLESVTYGSRADDIPLFTFGAFLRDTWTNILIALFCLINLGFMLGIFHLNVASRVLIVSFVGLCMLAMLLVNYLRRAHYYREVVRFSKQIGRLDQLADLVEEPHFLEGRIFHETANTLAYIADTENRRERDQARAHREYIELWIHDIKTPIAAEKLLLSDMHGVQAMKLKAETERIESLVDQALYSARSASLTNDYTIREVSLAQAIQSSCKKNAHYLIERNVGLKINVDDAVTVLADEPWLVFMISQVIINAAKYGAQTIEFTSSEEEVGTPREHTYFEIKDDGSGIPAEDVPRVFERGFTGQVGRAQGSATGMGLYLVACICESMGIGVSIASEEGKGTRVMFAFPHDRRRGEAQTNA